jgi:hypothetical protein
MWGGLAAMAFYALVVDSAQQGSLMASAFSGEAAPFKATACWACFAGLTSLGLRAMRLAVEFGAVQRPALPPAPSEGQAADDVAALVDELNAAPPSFESTCFGKRLRQALELVRQRGSAEWLETDLAELAEADRRNLIDRYATIRLMAASIGMIGVAGAAACVGTRLSSLPAGELSATLSAALAGIGVGCGGLVQAAVLTIALLAAKLGVERVERRLLVAVDRGANAQLLGRFAAVGRERDPSVSAVQRISEKLLATVEGAAQRQDEALSKSLATAARRWEDMAASANSLLQRTLSESLTTGLKEHAQAINEGVIQLGENLQTTVVRHAEILGENIDHHTAALAESLEQHQVALAKSLESNSHAVSVAMGSHAHAISDALSNHTAALTATERSLAAEHQRRLADMEAALGESLLLNATRQEDLIRHSEHLLKEMQTALVESAGTTVAQQEQLIRQGDTLLKVVEATGQIRRLEETLNSNLASLAAAHNFEQTAASLAAAVQLLSVRLRQPAIVRNEIELSGDTKSQAA